MAEDEINCKCLASTSQKIGNPLQPTNTVMAENKATVCSVASDNPVSSASGVPSFQIRQHFIPQPGLHLANNAVVVPVQGLSSQAGISQGNNIQLPKAGVPLLGANTVSGQLTFQTPPVSHAAFPQAISPMSQSVPVTTALVGQQVTLQRGQQVTLQRGQHVTLQRFPNKGQPIAVQRFPAVLPASIQHVQRAGTSANLGKVQLARQVISQANNNLQLPTKSSVGIGAGQSHQSNLRIPSPVSQQVTVQRIISPVVAQQNSGIVSSPIIPNAVSQAMTVNLHNASPVGTATILPGQQITIQPRPAGTLIAGPSSTPITLTVTSISPASAVISSSSTVSVISHPSTSQVQPFIQRPGVVISQPSVIRTGIPVVLPRAALALAGRPQVLQGTTLQRLIQRPLVSPAGNCGGQVTVQIPHIVGPIIKMPNYKQPVTPTTSASSSKESPVPNASSPISTNVITSADAFLTTSAGTVKTSTVASTHDAFAGLAVMSSVSTLPATHAMSAPSAKASATTSAVCTPPLLTSTPITKDSEMNKPASSGLENSHVSTSCVTTSSVQTTKESSVTTLNTESKDSRKDDISNGNPGSNVMVSAENSEAFRTPTSNLNSEGRGEPTSAVVSEVSNISVLPGNLSSLRQHNKSKSSFFPSSHKDFSPKEENTKNSGTILTEGFIDSNLLDWNDKVGTLPGTDMKFKINEFGDLELLEEGDNGMSDIKTEVVEDEEGEDSEIIHDDEEDEDDDVDEEDDGDRGEEVPAVNDPGELSEREDDPICCCIYCGRYGYKSNFRTSGRFCSQTCAGKKNMHRKQLLMSRMIQESKKKKKKMVIGGEANSAALNEESNGLDKTHSSFDWDKYLVETNSVGAPKRLFKEPFPTTRNSFKVGMRLEGVDPKHQALTCVLSVAEIQGFRLRLHFDGYSECYDFWVNADSPFIFPVGWAEKNGKTLQPPKNRPISEFNWTSYLKQTRAVTAPKHLFLNQPSSITPSAFRVGMKLEAMDQKTSSLYCVSSVADTLGDRILIHYDGWEDIYDFWCDITSPNIRPIGWCHQNHKKLSSPPDYGDEKFQWDNYLVDTKSTAVPSRAFKPRSPVGFESGMKLEVTDKRNPILIRVATVKKVKNGRLSIHFDGWGDIYDYWIDDEHSDLHPPNWCAKTFHPLQGPIDKEVIQQEESSGGCPTLGCKGIGHIKGAKYTGHHSDFGCPYSTTNMSKETCLADRLGSSRSEEGGVVLIRHDYHGDIRRCPTPGCNGMGHVTGKFTSHHCVSGCPLAEKNLQKVKQEAGPETRPVGRPARGRKRKMFGFHNFGPHGKHIKTETMDGPSEEVNLFHASIHESVFQSMSVYPPERDQPLGWSDHTKLLPGVFSIDSSLVDKWSIDQVADFVQTLTGKEEQAQRFREEEIDGDSFLLLQQSDLVNFLNIKLGPAVKIFNSIQVFKAGMDT